MVAKVLHPMVAFFLKDFLAALRSRRLIGVSILLGALLMGTGFGLSHLNLGLIDAEEPPSPLEVWHRGGDGILTAIAFGIVPIFVPFLAVTLANRNMFTDRSRGLFELSLLRAVPPWGRALGKFLGLFAASAIPILAAGIGTVLVIQGVLGVSLSSSLVASFLLYSLLLVALYLILTLAMATVFDPGLVATLVALIWLGFNVIRPTSIVMVLRMATLLGATEALVFLVEGSDLASFTGLFHGLLSAAVPPSLAFVIPLDPSLLASQIAQAALPWVSVAWLVTLFVVFSRVLYRVPSK